MIENSPTFLRYEVHLRATVDWIRRSIKHGGGGSAAYSSYYRGWSRPYPETSGYIIPTLLDAANHLNDKALAADAIKLGNWLLDLQGLDGWWPGGLHGAKSGRHPSIFNTAQILEGMVALAHRTGDDRWHAAAIKGANWLAKGVDADGLWQTGNYRSGFNPSYYTQVAWPMLQVWKIAGDESVREAALRVLKRVIALKTPHGSIAGWGFDPDKPAFTHTIAYTLRGLIESAILLEDWNAFGEPCMGALERLNRKAEFTHGRLPGAFFDDWSAVDWYTCLTGNAQVSLCLLRLEQREGDLRLVNSAAKLVDYVCGRQHVQCKPALSRGAVAGSSPLWGRYMFMRYPNWAAKYHADALMMLRGRLSQTVTGG